MAIALANGLRLGDIESHSKRSSWLAVRSGLRKARLPPRWSWTSGFRWRGRFVEHHNILIVFIANATSRVVRYIVQEAGCFFLAAAFAWSLSGGGDFFGHSIASCLLRTSSARHVEWAVLCCS